jgi:hypothetical protein
MSSLAETIATASDEELAQFAEGCDHAADLAKGGLAAVKPKGSA